MVKTPPGSNRAFSLSRTDGLERENKWKLTKTKKLLKLTWHDNEIVQLPFIHQPSTLDRIFSGCLTEYTPADAMFQFA